MGVKQSKPEESRSDAQNRAVQLLQSRSLQPATMPTAATTALQEAVVRARELSIAKLMAGDEARVLERVVVLAEIADRDAKNEYDAAMKACSDTVFFDASGHPTTDLAGYSYAICIPDRVKLNQYLQEFLARMLQYEAQATAEYPGMGGIFGTPQLIDSRFSAYGVVRMSDGMVSTPCQPINFFYNGTKYNKSPTKRAFLIDRNIVPNTEILAYKSSNIDVYLNIPLTMSDKYDMGDMETSAGNAILLMTRKPTMKYPPGVLPEMAEEDIMQKIQAIVSTQTVQEGFGNMDRGMGSMW
jgi:hypothetical protein